MMSAGGTSRVAIWGERNQSLFDYWSIAHLVSGFGAGFLGAGFWATLVAGTVYELVEPAFDYEVFGRGFTRHDYRPESLGNRVVDVVAIAAGWAIGSAARRAR